SVDPSDPSRLRFEQWIAPNASGRPRALTIDGQRPGLGFPGTESAAAYPGARALLDDETFVFVVDSDGDLSTHETFPQDHTIVLHIEPAMRSRFGSRFGRVARACASVGADVVAVEV